MRRFLLIVVVLLLAVALARAVFRLPSNEARPASQALAPDAGTPLGQALLPQAEAHPGLSGIRPLWPGMEAYAARMVLAHAARQSIDARYYIWQRDGTGLSLLQELKAAADRGVRVRLLVDDNGTPDLDAELAALNTLPSFEVRVFNPFSIRSPRALSYPLDFPRINRRMHNKSFTVDGVATIVGGRNIGDIYFARDAEVQYSDFDILATGAVVARVADDFDAYWNAAAAYPHDLLVSPPPDLSALDATFAAARSDPDSQAYARAVADSPLVRDLLARSLDLEWVPVTLLSDDPRKALGDAPAGTLLATALAPLLGQARQSVDVISAYFVPGRDGTERLAFAARQGLHVRILTNSLDATDVLPVHAAYGKYREPLLSAGVEVFELRRTPRTRAEREAMGLLGSSGASLHAKVFAIDRRAVFVGSFNFDPRSIWLNCEMGFWIESPLLATAISDALDRGAGGATWQVGLDPDGALTWTGKDTAATRDEPGSTAFKRLTLGLLSILPVEWMM